MTKDEFDTLEIGDTVDHYFAEKLSHRLKIDIKMKATGPVPEGCAQYWYRSVILWNKKHPERVGQFFHLTNPREYEFVGAMKKFKVLEKIYDI